jgi:2-C-methyl-D-erythritol 4-phosphate cytidylyltransferase
MPAASLIVAAGGSGRRFAEAGGRAALRPPLTKAFALLAGRPVLAHTLERFAAVPNIAEAVVAVPEPALAEARRLFGAAFGADRPLKFVPGGLERPDSVSRALAATDPTTELVIVHDAVRPLIRRAIIEEAMRVAIERGAAVVGWAVDHTVKRVRNGRTVEATVSRQDLWLAQTPQVFRREIIARAYAARANLVGQITDDAQLVEAAGQEVVMVPGDVCNVKITTPEDLRVCEMLLAAGWPGAGA